MPIAPFVSLFRYLLWQTSRDQSQQTAEHEILFFLGRQSTNIEIDLLIFCDYHENISLSASQGRWNYQLVWGVHVLYVDELKYRSLSWYCQNQGTIDSFDIRDRYWILYHFFFIENLILKNRPMTYFFNFIIVYSDVKWNWSPDFVIGRNILLLSRRVPQVKQGLLTVFRAPEITPRSW